jgi:type IV pilus assembly protein PilF
MHKFSAKFSIGVLIMAGALNAWAQKDTTAQLAQRKEDSAQAHIELATNYYQAGRIEIAQEELMRVLATDPQNSSANDLLGLLYLKSGNTAQAETAFKTAITSNAYNSSAQTNYGTLLCKSGRYEAGMEAYGKALQTPVRIQVSKTLVNGGICLTQKGDLAGAEKFFLKALEQEPFMPSALYQLAKVYYATQRFDQADSRLMALHKQTEPNAASTLLMYQLAVAEGKQGQAGALAQKLQTRFADSPEAQQIKTR